MVMCMEKDHKCFFPSSSSTTAPPYYNTNNDNNNNNNNFEGSTFSSLLEQKDINYNSQSTSNIMESFIIKFLYTDFFLILFMFGFCGNLLNLLVLLSKKMRNRTNILFAAMAFADLGFLLLSLFPCVYMKWYIYLPGWFKAFYIRNNILTTWLINWLSAFSIWLMLAVTIERLAVVRKPFGQYRPLNLRFVFKMLTILILSLLVTLHKYLSIKTETDNSGKYVHRNIKNKSMFIITIWGWVHALSVVVIPNIILLLCNVMLITNLRKQAFPVELAKENNQPLIINRTKTEKKITYIIVIILTTFLACNMPGAIIYLLQTLNITFEDKYYNQLLQVISNTLTTIGKVLNFGLFCLSSKHFRKSLIEQLIICTFYLRNIPYAFKNGKSQFLDDSKIIQQKYSFYPTESVRLSTRERLMTVTTNNSSSTTTTPKGNFSKPHHHSFHFPIIVGKASSMSGRLGIEYSLKKDYGIKCKNETVDTRVTARRAASTAL